METCKKVSTQLPLFEGTIDFSFSWKEGSKNVSIQHARANTISIPMFRRKNESESRIC